MKIISNECHSEERAFYNSRNVTFSHCVFQGEEDGESAIKESRKIDVDSCDFHLRYPLWHNTDLSIQKSTFFDTCRAPIWYTGHVTMEGTSLCGPKAFRECRDIFIKNSTISSDEFGWMCRQISLSNTKFDTSYGFFHSSNISADGINFHGKYSFQYTSNIIINHSVLDTKDAFWHSKNVTIKDSVIKGEYLGWYSKNLTLENCEILGTQPFCYCTNLTLINCTMKDCDLAFEYSSVNAKINGNLISIKNPKSGTIIVDNVDQIIRVNPTKKCNTTIIVNHNISK